MFAQHFKLRCKNHTVDPIILALAALILLLAHPFAMFLRSKTEEAERNLPKKRQLESLVGRELLVIILTTIPVLIQICVYLVAIVLSSQLLGINVLEPLLYSFLLYLPNIFLAGLYLVVGILAARLSSRIIHNLIESFGAESLLPFSDPLAAIFQYFVILLTILVAISQLGFETDLINQMFLAFTIITLLSFTWFLHTAAAPYLPDVFAGLLIRKNRLFIPGEYVIYEGKRHRIMVIGSVHSRLRSGGKEIIVGNSALLKNAKKVIKDEKGG